jgi:hypothetical protein
MLMRFDPVDRFGRASRGGRADSPAVPMEAHRRGDEFVACLTCRAQIQARSTSRFDPW